MKYLAPRSFMCAPEWPHSALGAIVTALTLLASLVPCHAFAYEYNGRASVGGFLAKEELTAEPQSGKSNDAATLSGRFYYNASKFSMKGLSFTSDLRDKNDFFGKLDKEKLTLTPKNSAQVRQMTLRRELDDSGLIWQLGRYAIPDAGAAFTDGASLGWRFTRSFSVEAFGGYNPKELDKSYLQYNSKAKDYGAFARWESREPGWYQYKAVDFAYVTDTYLNQIDRQYYYNRSLYVWGRRGLLSDIIYLDMIPKPFVQNGQILYNQGWTKAFTTNLTLTAFDVITYRRVQDVRETIAPSPYKGAALKSIWSTDPRVRWSLTTRYGKRQIDNLERVDGILELQLPRYFSKKVDMAVRVARKKEFTKNGTFVGASWGYFSRVTEFEVRLDTGVEHETAGGTLHPIIGDFAMGFQLSRVLYGAADIEVANDEKVKFIAGFVKLTYRFGNKELAPLRNGAPPRGRL